MRRPNGTGTVVKLSGTRRSPYAVRIPSRDKRGRVIQCALSYHRTAAEAQAALDDYNRRKAEGKAPAADALSTTVQQVYDGWSARAYAKLNPPSVQSHKAAWNKRVSRYSAHKMRDMTLDQWQSILDEDEDDGLGQSTINNDAILIKALYAYSMERDIVGKDYSTYLDVPTVDLKRPRNALNDLQLHRLEQLAAEGRPWADVALILCYTGFRISEALSLTQFSYHREHGGYLQGGGKTASGRGRIIPVHQKVRPYLERRLSMGGQTILCHEDGRPVTGDWFRAGSFRELMETIGAPEATPHWCRHTFATRLHASEVDSLTIKWLMGHSTKSDITAHYTHETIEVLLAAVGKLA